MGNPSQPEQTPSRDSLHRLHYTESPEQTPHSAIDPSISSFTNDITQIPFPPDAFTSPASYIQLEHTPQTQATLAQSPSDPYSPAPYAFTTPRIPPPPPPSSFYITPFTPKAGEHENPYDYASPYISAPVLPLPLDEAIQQLPGQYIRVLARPSVSTFHAETGKAAWNITWFQIILYALLVSIFALLRYHTNPTSPLQLTSTFISSWGVIVIPLSTLVGTGFLYLAARMVGGRGTFLQQSYVTCLYTIPLGILGNILQMIPTTGIFLYVLVEIYALVLYFYMLRAVHHLSLARSIVASIISLVIAIVLAVLAVLLVLVVAFIVIIYMHVR